MPYQVVVAAVGAAEVGSSNVEKRETAGGPPNHLELLFLQAGAGPVAGGAFDGLQEAANVLVLLLMLMAIPDGTRNWSSLAVPLERGRGPSFCAVKEAAATMARC